MGIWQWIIVVLWGLSFLSGMVLDGKPRIDGDGNPQKYHLVNVIANIAILFIILYFGGFFK